jgi:hypothetical protein
MSATLRHLESLARERASDKRRALLHAISDCLFGSGEHTSTEVAAAGGGPDASTSNGVAEESRAVLADRLRAASKMARPLGVLVEQVERGLMKLDEAVTELADADATPEVAKLIADRVALRPDTVTRALCALADEPVVVLCRAAGLKMNGYSAIVRMRRRRRPGSDCSPAQVLEKYRQIPLETAQRVLHFLKIRETAEAS